MSKKTIFLVAGRSAVGKSSLVHAVCEKTGLVPVKSYATRQPRPGETSENSDHIFISEEDVAGYENDMVAYTEINGVKYFVTREILDKSDIYVIDPAGIKFLLDTVGDEYNFVQVYIRVPNPTAKQRAAQRGDTVFEERRKSEDEQFSRYEHDMPWQYHILNDGTFESGVEKLERIIRKEQKREKAETNS